jgi:hypothetical protein
VKYDPDNIPIRESKYPVIEPKDTIKDRQIQSSIATNLDSQEKLLNRLRSRKVPLLEKPGIKCALMELFLHPMHRYWSYRLSKTQIPEKDPQFINLIHQKILIFMDLIKIPYLESEFGELLLNIGRAQAEDVYIDPVCDSDGTAITTKAFFGIVLNNSQVKAMIELQHEC